MKITPPKKQRASVEKQHYWLQIDFNIRAETLDMALRRCAAMFRRTYRQKLTMGLVYMGAHSATCRGDLKGPRTMHPTVVLKKGLPILPGVDLATLDAETAARVAAKAARKAKKQEFTLAGLPSVSTSIPASPGAPVGAFVGTMEPDGKTVSIKMPTDAVITKTLKAKKRLVKGSFLSGLMK